MSEPHDLLPTSRPMAELRALAVSNGLTAEAVRQEIASRRVTIGHLVGWLYPDILRSEIDELLDMLHAIENQPQDPRTARSTVDK